VHDKALLVDLIVDTETLETTYITVLDDNHSSWCILTARDVISSS